MDNFDFTGWATRANLKCSDGRTIMKDAFKGNDGQKVPLVFGHQHNDPSRVLGHALLENRDEGVYVYGYFNDTEQGQQAKALVQHGDITALSIYANQLKHNSSNVIHGNIREVSLVLAGANPGAFIDSVIMHGEESDEDAVIFTDEEITLCHEDNSEKEKNEMANEPEKKPEEGGKTVQDVINSMTEEQQNVMYALIGMANGADEEDENSEEDNEMKHNVFENDEQQGNFLTHADQEEIIKMAKTSSVGTFQEALKIYAEQHQIQHDAFDEDDMESLLPEYQLIDPKEPKIIYPDDTWVSNVINGVHKSPIARVRTRRADARQADLKAKGYKKAEYKKHMNQINLIGRTHDAQTIYVKDALNRDDILDITDFDIVNYQWKIMRHSLNQTLAEAIMIGDGRDELDPDKIKEDHIRPIWKDDDMYCMHFDVDFAAMGVELTGTNNGANFGDNYVKAEAIIAEALYAREQYKGSGNLTFYCTPHMLNVMLLARDLNGRRIYASKADLVAALNVKDIITVEQFEGLTRTTDDNKVKKLIGLFVNLVDYQLGCVRGGEITRFEQFDIDFNQQKMLLETRCSGALVELYSAIALEEDVTDAD